jgi:predicted transcriptional regulator
MTDLGQRPIERPRIADYMARELVTLAPQTEINRAMQVLLDARISGAPVVDDRGFLLGVLSKKDCLRAALQASYYRQWGGRVEDYMTREVQTLDAELDIVAAAEAFVASPFRRFPVLRHDRLVGQVSRSDILRALAEHWG